MDVVPDTAHQRPRRTTRRPTHLEHNGCTQSPVKKRKSKSTACRQVAPPNNNEVNDRIERRFRAIAAVRVYVHGINLNRQLIQDRAEQQLINAEIRREGLIAAVRNHVLNINMNYPQIVDPLVDVIEPVVIDPVERRFNETQARDQLKADLILAGKGIVPDILLIDQIAMKTTMNNFINKINTTKMETCKYCSERWFNDGGKYIGNNEFVCKDDLPGHNKSIKTNVPYIGKFSKENNMNPYYHPNPEAMEDYRNLMLLSKPTKIECALFSNQRVIMKIYKLKGPHGGSNFGTSGNVVNVPQDLGPLCRIFPRLVWDSGFFYVRSSTGVEPNDYKDFKVRRFIVFSWLTFLKKWNIAYKDIEINLINLNLLPVDGSVFHQLPILEPDNHDVVENIPANNLNNDNQINNVENVNRNENDSDDDGGVEDGPINDFDFNEDNILESSVGVQAISNDEAQAIVEMILDPPNIDVRPRDDNMDILEPPIEIDNSPINLEANEAPFDPNIPINWPEAGKDAVDEYNTAYFLSNMNPFLLPFGTGDCTDKVRLYDVSFHDSIQHYQRFALQNPTTNEWYWPFAENHAFMHVCQDMDIRRRIQSQASIFLEQNPSTANLLIEELREMARNSNGHSAFVTDQKMQRYGANILGTFFICIIVLTYLDIFVTVLIYMIMITHEGI